MPYRHLSLEQALHMIDKLTMDLEEAAAKIFQQKEWIAELKNKKKKAINKPKLPILRLFVTILLLLGTIGVCIYIPLNIDTKREIHRQANVTACTRITPPECISEPIHTRTGRLTTTCVCEIQDGTPLVFDRVIRQE